MNKIYSQERINEKYDLKFMSQNDDKIPIAMMTDVDWLLKIDSFIFYLLQILEVEMRGMENNKKNKIGKVVINGKSNYV